MSEIFCPNPSPAWGVWHGVASQWLTAMSLFLNSCGRQVQSLRSVVVTSNRELLVIWNGRGEPQWIASGGGALLATCPVQIIKCCNIFMAGIWNLWFYILSEVLFCTTTRAVSPLIALFGWMVLQVEAPGLDGGSFGRVGLGLESPGHKGSWDFVSLVPFFLWAGMLSAWALAGEGLLFWKCCLFKLVRRSI